MKVSYCLHNVKSRDELFIQSFYKEIDNFLSWLMYWRKLRALVEKEEKEFRSEWDQKINITRVNKIKKGNSIRILNIRRGIKKNIS